MKVVFINPNMIAGVPGDSMEPLVFSLLSALTPDYIERRLYDERIENLPTSENADLAVLTADTFSAKRAYQIACIYRQRGVPVVIGGFHPSLCPDEAAQYVDSVIIGDAEDTWPKLISDAENKTLQPKYQSTYPSFGETEPDRTIFEDKSYSPVGLVESKRGCRFACDFCSISAMYSGKLRHKSQQHVLRDLDKSCKPYLLFTDDNFFSDINSLKSILDELRKRQLQWACQISTDVIKHPEIIPLMRKAGCVVVLMGFESLNRHNLNLMRKSWNENDYKQVIRMFHDNGVMVYGTFIFGYDYDTPDVFERTLHFAIENRLFLANFNPLFPTPGTALYSRLQSDKRLLFNRWWLHDDYRWGNSLFLPRRMTPDQLSEGCYRIRIEFNKYSSLLVRFPGLDLQRTSPRKALLFVMANIVSRRELNRKYGKALGDTSSALQSGAIKAVGTCT